MLKLWTLSVWVLKYSYYRMVKMVSPFELLNNVDSAASNMTHVHSVENDVLQYSTDTCADLCCIKPG